MSRTASIVALVAIVIGIAVFAFLGINGMPVGRYDILPFSKSISQASI